MSQCAHAAREARAPRALLFVGAGMWPRMNVAQHGVVHMAARRGGRGGGRGGRGRRARAARRQPSRGVAPPSPPQSESTASDAPAAPSADDAPVADGSEDAPPPNAVEDLSAASLDPPEAPDAPDPPVVDVAAEAIPAEAVADAETAPADADAEKAPADADAEKAPADADAEAAPADTVAEAAPADSDAQVPNADVFSELPVPDEAVFKLPEEPVATRGARRRRRQRRGSKSGADDAASAEDEGPLPEAEIARLTREYRTGGPGREELVERIEQDPDYMFRGGNPKGEYGLAAAIIGTGRPNKQGVYVLPYLQSSHLILLGVILLGTFVYYPGFPLTEGSEEVREMLRRGLAVVFAANLALAVYSYAEAKKRGQPPLFWFFKVALLGNIALQELRANAPVKGEGAKVRRRGKR